jgi:hypothetical protein
MRAWDIRNGSADLKASISAIHTEKRRALDEQKRYLDRCLVRFHTAADFGQLLLEQVCSKQKDQRDSLYPTSVCA